MSDDSANRIDGSNSTETPAELSRRRVLASAAAGGVAAMAAPLLNGCARSNPAAQVAKHEDAQTASFTPAAPTTLNVNGQAYPLAIEPRVSLLDALREDLHLAGTKKGCDHGQCGACTVLVDGRRVNSCLTLAVATVGKQITTIEGLAKGEQLHPVQSEFIRCDAFQCGYCTPGQICSAVGLINEGHAHTDDEIREEMSGNICRCGAYPNIVEAVRNALKQPA